LEKSEKLPVEPFAGFVVGSSLINVVDVWQPVAEVLGLTLKESAEFVEKVVYSSNLLLYTSEDFSGLWKAIGRQDPSERDKGRDWLTDLWQDAEMRRWDRSELNELGSHLRISPESRAAILAAAIRVREASPPSMDLGQTTEAAGVSKATMPQLWPWGTHSTKLLKVFADAASHFWRLYDPDEPSTAPTNDQVVAWLVDRKVSRRLAETMATILRADDLPSGPRK
jgi:hypothetical protein